MTMTTLQAPDEREYRRNRLIPICFFYLVNFILLLTGLASGTRHAIRMTCKHDKRNNATSSERKKARITIKSRRRLRMCFELPHKSRSRTMKENQCHVVWFTTNRESCIDGGRLCNVQNDPFCSILNNI